MKKKSSARPSLAARNKIKHQYQSWVSCYGSKRVRVTARPLVGGSSGLIKAVIFSVSDVNLVARRKKEPSPHYSEKVRNSVLAADLRMAINSAKQKLKTQSDDHALTFIAQQFLCAMEFRRFNRANRAAKFKPKNRADFKKIINVKNLVSWWRSVSSGAENISFSWVKLRVPTVPAMATVSAYKPRRKYALWLLDSGTSPVQKYVRVKRAAVNTTATNKVASNASEVSSSGDPQSSASTLVEETKSGLVKEKKSLFELSPGSGNALIRIGDVYTRIRYKALTLIEYLAKNGHTSFPNSINKQDLLNATQITRTPKTSLKDALENQIEDPSLRDKIFKNVHRKYYLAHDVEIIDIAS